jgi:molybdenum cofactor synthesis domain-containing protein
MSPGQPDCGYTCGLLSIGNRGACGTRPDSSGPALAEVLTSHGFTLAATAIVPDVIDEIRHVLLEWVEETGLDLIITTGGTGLSPRDLTPEATRPLLDREIPGIPEAMRLAVLAQNPHAMLSRGLAGTRDRTLIINLPDSTRAASENLAAVIEVLPHALAKLKDDSRDCGR